MLKHRHSISFLITLFLYVGIGFFLFSFKNMYVGTEKKPKEKVISISLAQYIPESPPLEEPTPEKEKEPEPVVEEKVEPLVPPVIEEVIPEPVIEKSLPKPIIKKPIVKKKPNKKQLKKANSKKKKVKKKIVKKHRIRKNTHQKSTHKKRSSKQINSKKQASPAKKNAFLANIRARINRSKAYPRIAQRRGMQGAVKVRFTILANGQIGNILVKGPKVFQRSAKNAIKKSFPISVKNAPLSLPATVNLILQFKLK